MSDYRKIIQFLESEIESKSFPGVGVLVSQHGRRVLEFFAGTYCNPFRRDNPLNADVRHMLYSFSKGISATVIVLARQRGLIDYDAPLFTYIPEFRGTGKDAITIRHLLTHSAGLAKVPFTAADTQDGWEDCLQRCLDAPLEWEPGSRTEYHAWTGMFLAAEAVRRTHQSQSWDSICREWLFDPIGAKSLTFCVPCDENVSLTSQPNHLPCKVDGRQFGLLGHPGGGAFGRMEDMLKVLQLHLNRGKWAGKTIMEPSEFEEMHRVQFEAQIVAAEKNGERPVHEPWGLGWLLRWNLENHWFGFGSNTSQRTFGHVGINTVLAVGEPHRQLAIAFLTTDSPCAGSDRSISDMNTIRIRNTVTDLIVAAGEQ